MDATFYVSSTAQRTAIRPPYMSWSCREAARAVPAEARQSRAIGPAATASIMHTLYGDRFRISKVDKCNNALLLDFWPDKDMIVKLQLILPKCRILYQCVYFVLPQSNIRMN